MASSDVKSKTGKEDLSLWGGSSVKTFTRRTSTGGALTLHKIGNDVDVLAVYGDGTTPTHTDLTDAIAGIAGAECCFELASGTWPVTADLTIPSNVTIHLRRGAAFSVSAGVTLTLSGPVIAEESTWYSGAGTVVYTAGGGFFPLVDDLASTAAGKGSRLVGVTGQSGKNVGDLFDGGKDVPLGCSTMDASGNATVGGTLGVTGASTVAAVTASGAVVAQSTLDVTGQTTVANLSASGTLGGKLAFRGALVYRSSNQSINSGSNTPILFDSEDHDTSSIHDVSSNTDRLTVPVGVTRIRIVGQITYAVDSTGFRSAQIVKNGGTTYRGAGLPYTQAIAVDSTVVQAQTPVITVSAGDYFKLNAYHNQGGPLNVLGSGNGNLTWFAMEIIE